MSEPRNPSDPTSTRPAQSISAWVRLSLRTPDGTRTRIAIGVTGSLHDVACLLFAPVPEATP